MDILITDPTERRAWTLTEDEVENIVYESVVPGGFSVASWIDRRDITRSYPDLKKFNRVTIRDGSTTCWQGWMNRPKRVVKSSQFEVSCLGWSSRLQQLGWSTNLAAQSPYTFVTGTMLADTRILLGAGDIRQDGFTAAAMDTYPRKKYAEIMDEYMKQLERWYWTVFEDRLLDWRQYGLGAADYIVLLEECETGDVTEASPEYANYICFSWSEDGSAVEVSAVQDDAEVMAAGMVVEKYLALPGTCSESDATAWANVALAEAKLAKMQAGFTTSIMLDAKTYEPVDLKKPRAGSKVMVSDLATVQEAVAASSQAPSLATFMMKALRYENAGPRVAVVPGDFSSRVDVAFARMESWSR